MESEDSGAEATLAGEAATVRRGTGANCTASVGSKFSKPRCHSASDRSNWSNSTSATANAAKLDGSGGALLSSSKLNLAGVTTARGAGGNNAKSSGGTAWVSVQSRASNRWKIGGDKDAQGIEQRRLAKAAAAAGSARRSAPHNRSSSRYSAIGRSVRIKLRSSNPESE